ncbi:bifunctional folylpolyglutamate synthase/dihydrofolate synthase [Streptococcus anginosus]|uniref:tetrahydrofolate synthase n=1 Tax=Streptococcus anginosus subsp. whileyi CCUG 39159 TaxID=1095729 RepID=I0S7N2_STRAP|nr:folylpolyglutamate synthase/dihydrofolate synthase family protein [Streptococcus anginosus]AGU84394.1 dihydrofolate synthase [Streptococcus anginosus C238]EID19385.1 bifunctional protein FolC [Streptococcus anginosus subsp. whileyi CCUG 39159]MDB8660800.1 bifunctional folylpolyglutamate synthase/dihydrofolate synthase [Streptococcus anginosus]MDP1385985.1 folylpolyglutamate synthase/dihydrofolate synthase family protein [Streptococcus anginosus]QQT08685.1 bifunctional folylpolyglutamate syn
MNEIETWLESRIGLNFRSGLERMRQAISLLDHPEENYPIIHVTGTNGKGSTIAFMSQLFVQHEKKVGTFTSPHMASIHDRICINHEPISDNDFIRIGHRIQAMEKQLLQPLSYFEILTLMALLYFNEEQVEVALIEVGIGGLLDTTNVLTGDIAVVTSVGLDHQETLGDSIVAIAEQKAGIFKEKKIAVIGPLAEEARRVCELRANELETVLYEYGRDFSFSKGQFFSSDVNIPHLKLSLAGTYQEENAAVALQSFLLFMGQHSWQVKIELVRKALQETHWAGRLEYFERGIYLDGAHNLPALSRLVEFIRQQGQKEIFLLFGALKRKNYQGMLSYLQQELPHVQLFVTTFEDDGAANEQDFTNGLYIASYQDFIEQFIKSANDNQLLFVTGSLYFIAEVRAFLLEKEID